jgi:hypothetical protein
MGSYTESLALVRFVLQLVGHTIAIGIID